MKPVFRNSYAASDSGFHAASASCFDESFYSHRIIAKLGFNEADS